jgi:hypothetical protein
VDGFKFDSGKEEIDIVEALCDHFFDGESDDWDDQFEDLPEEECDYDPMDPNGIGEE